MINEIAQKKYKFSIITAVYNIELFLEEAVESVINQDIGFEENVQLILIDDGSIDKSGEICDKYHAAYPNNVLVIHKENGGVSEARNEGLKYVKGEYVNFLDGDDKLAPNALRVVYKQFQEWEESVDIITIPICYFDAKSGNHILNYKFKLGTRIIDLEKEWDKLLLSSSASFFCYDVLKKYYFDKELAYAEDAKVILQILLQKKKYGVVKETQYLYRKRSEGSESAIQSRKRNKKWYLNCVIQFSLWSLENSRKRNNGVIPLFVQNTVMYDLQWRFNTKDSPTTVLNEGEYDKYITALKAALYNIDDKVIMKQRWMDEAHKIYALKLKYGVLPSEKKENNDIKYFYNKQQLFSESNFSAKFQFIDIRDTYVEIEGEMFFSDITSHKKIEMFLSVNGKLYPCTEIERNNYSKSLGEKIACTKGFKCGFDTEPNSSYAIKIGCKINDYYVEKKNVEFGKFFPISNNLWNSYFACKPYILTYKKNAIYLKPYKLPKHAHHEISFLKAIWETKCEGTHEIVKNRIRAHIYRLFNKKEIWLISDRIHKADDNGEVLFEYLNQKRPKGIKYYFAISEQSPDYPRLNECGRVIEFRGEKYNFLSLCGAKIISSQADDYVFRPFRKESWYYADLLYANKFVFLQHGVIKDDLSRELKKSRKNIRMFVTSTKAEYDSILEYPYGYDEKVVKLTGMPRYDKLYSDEKKCITVMPSWRSYLVKRADSNDDLRNVRVGFEDSQYNKMYSELLTNKELLSYLKEREYKLCFLNHFNMDECISRMLIDANVNILSTDNMFYSQVVAESNLLITDYSAAAFDFAYLRKPVLYLQSDKEEFFGGKHIYDQGYFDYEKDGFGEVVYDTDTLISLIMEYIQTDCKIKEQYSKRIENTFEFCDKENTQRVFEVICKM